MIYLKTFEHYDSDDRLPEVGEYVLLNPEEVGEIASNRIGEVVELLFLSDSRIMYYVYYEDYISDRTTDGKTYNVAFELSRDQSRTPMGQHVLAWSSDKEKLELIIQSNKYNL